MANASAIARAALVSQGASSRSASRACAGEAEIAEFGAVSATSSHRPRPPFFERKTVTMGPSGPSEREMDG